MMPPRNPAMRVVLLVEGDDDRAERTAAHLERAVADVSVERVARAEAARSSLEAVDCVVSEYDLPGGDGLELLEFIRDHHPALPFILYTVAGSEAVASEAIALGVTEYLPAHASGSRDRLARRVERAISEAEARSREAAEARTERDRLAQGLDALEDVVFLLDADARVHHHNDAAGEVLGYDAGAIDDRPALDLVAPDHRDRVRETIATVRTGERATVEADLLRADGGRTRFDVSVS
ncbi:MAG: response regulator, partial [Halobacteriales archaeon]